MEDAALVSKPRGKTQRRENGTAKGRNRRGDGKLSTKKKKEEIKEKKRKEKK